MVGSENSFQAEATSPYRADHIAIGMLAFPYSVAQYAFNQSHRNRYSHLWEIDLRGDEYAFGRASIPDCIEFSTRLPDDPLVERGMPRSLFRRALLRGSCGLVAIGWKDLLLDRSARECRDGYDSPPDYHLHGAHATTPRLHAWLRVGGAALTGVLLPFSAIRNAFLVRECRWAK